MVSMSVLPAALALAAMAASGAAWHGQEPTFKGVNRTVAVYAPVMGADNRLVPDLPREAFSVYAGRGCHGTVRADHKAR